MKYAKVQDYQNPSGPPAPPTNTSPASPASTAAVTSTVANAAAGTTATGAPAPPPPPAPPQDTFAIISYSFPDAPPIDETIFQSPFPADEELPFLPDYTTGTLYSVLVADTFKPINPIPPPPATQRIVLTTSQDSWGGKERDVMNSLAYSPDPALVPLLVGMYNGEITVDDCSIKRALANNGFDNKTGAIVIATNATVEFVLQNQIGDLGISVPHPVFLFVSTLI
jgi:hypothetical protein